MCKTRFVSQGVILYVYVYIEKNLNGTRDTPPPFMENSIKNIHFVFLEPLPYMFSILITFLISLKVPSYTHSLETEYDMYLADCRSSDLHCHNNSLIIIFDDNF